MWPFTAEHTGKSLSEDLIFASTNPQFDDSLFIELQVQYSMFPIKCTVFLCTVTLVKNTVRLIGNIEYMKIPSSEHGKNMRRA